MRFMILIHSNATAEAVWASGDDPELEAAHGALIPELVASGELVDTNELDTEGAVVVGHHAGQPVAGVGPFTEGREWVGGYYIVDVVDQARAIEIAQHFAETKYSPVEVRRLMHPPRVD